MNSPVIVEIIAAPIACTQGFQARWREIAGFVAGQLGARFGDAVRVDYYDLFDPGCPPLPDGAELPVVYVDGDLLSSGGKVSVPAIRRRLEALGLHTPAETERTAEPSVQGS